jgi:nuclear transport factor 2 (NTF2) superfamily protein
VSLWRCRKINPRRRNHGNSNDAGPSPFAAVHPRERDSEGAPRRRWLEHSRSGRSEFINGRSEIIAFLSRKWAKELDYRLIKEMWAFTGNRIAVRFAYEWHDDLGHWYRSYGNENWEFNDDGLMVSRHASINDLPILEADRKYNWVLGHRPDNHGLSDLGL